LALAATAHVGSSQPWAGIGGAASGLISPRLMNRLIGRAHALGPHL